MKINLKEYLIKEVGDFKEESMVYVYAKPKGMYFRIKYSDNKYNYEEGKEEILLNSNLEKDIKEVFEYFIKYWSPIVTDIELIGYIRNGFYNTDDSSFIIEKIILNNVKIINPTLDEAYKHQPSMKILYIDKMSNIFKNNIEIENNESEEVIIEIK